MKTLFAHVVTCMVLFSASAQAASDADVTLLKVKTVTIEERVITIVVEKAKTRITLIRDNHDPAYPGDTWHGMPVSRVQVLSNEATFTIKQDAHSAPGGPLAKAWQDCLKTAKDLQDGKEVGRIGFYAPDIVIQGNLITSITGSGFLYPKGK
jgi:hypothetical protein